MKTPSNFSGWKIRVSLKVLLLLGISPFLDAQLDSPWTFNCDENNLCRRELRDLSSSSISLSKCKLTCGEFGALWPKPSQSILGNFTSYFLPNNITYSITSPPSIEPLLEEAVNIMLSNLEKYHPGYDEQGGYWTGPWDGDVLAQTVSINIEVNSTEEYLTMATDESYSLSVEELQTFTTTASIVAPSFFGARHALETLSQLINYEEASNSLQIVTTADITDAPVYKYRGMMLDTSRNFYAVEDLKRTIDGMSFNKLNTFHWHMTDSHSFPMELQMVPNMSYYGAYTPYKIYTSSDVQDLVQYARVRGIRIVPEMDAPAHEGNGWQWSGGAGLGDIAVCVNQEPWYMYCGEPPCGQLNIANQNLYTVLNDIYNEFLANFYPVEFFHYGGDEVHMNCWNSTEEIVDWMLSLGYNDLSEDDYINEWSKFQERVRQLVINANGGVPIPGILWTSALTEPANIAQYLSNEDYIIQIWTSGDDPVIGSLLEQGYRVIFSNFDAWYLDCGFGNWIGDGNNWCSPYKGWQAVYDNDPKEIALGMTGSTHDDLILGGITPLWSEISDGYSLDNRLWPRVAALGERLWSDPDESFEYAEYRMIHNRQRMTARGIRADRLQPEYCHQNEGTCYAFPFPPLEEEED